tara:strand:- start:1815 stop:4223 length:2409 start_codon:yes stop_codon:yes gene_type:complete
LKSKAILIFIGTLLTLSITSPPQFLNFFGLNFSDLALIVTVFSILLHALVKNNFKKIILDFKFTYWSVVSLILFFTFFIYGLNNLTIRFLFYVIFGYLIYLLLNHYSNEEIQYLFIPFISITILNFFTVIFQLSFLDNSIGWINYFYENPNFFQRGRLAGYQGGGPNVAGSMFIFLTFINYYFFKLTKNNFYFLITLLNLFLVFVTFSRGSYVALLIALLVLILNRGINLKTVFFSFGLFGLLTSSFFYFGDSQILLKESDRGYLTQIALDNLSLFKGYGGGNYVNEIYGNYFLSINPEILEENLNIKLDKVELGITPEEYRNSGIDFFVGTSGGGYEILQQSNIVDECTDDRITCQHVRVDFPTLLKFISSSLRIESELLFEINENTSCINSIESLVTRGEFDCLVQNIFKNSNLNVNSNLKTNDFFVPCEESGSLLCSDRKLAIGELAVIVEAITIKKNIVPVESYQIFCEECKFRNVEGYIKIKFDKYEGILPRSIFEFYTSPDGKTWDQVGFTRTKGKVIDFVPNNSYIEIGGHSDGQSFGNTFLDAEVKSLEIITSEKKEKIYFNKEKQNEDFYVFKPNSTNEYTANITYNENGIKLFRPNKYWLALDNNFNFNEDFEIIINLTIEEIPWESQTLISNTSIFDNQTQSWKLDIDDGRLYFYWANDEGVYIQDNVIGDKSLRSGILVQKNGKISNQSSPIVDPSYLSQLTTAHNGYLTFAVEYGLLFAAVFYLVIFFFIYEIYKIIENETMILFLAIIAFLVQNITNDLIYSSDMFILFNLIIAYLFYLTKPLEIKKS